jgi:hypothetical protein
MELLTEILIAAPPEVVWDVLVDFPRYPEWNPFITEITGTAAAGSRISVMIVAPGARGMRIRPVLLAVDRPRELRWKGALAFAALFTGEHSFVIEPHESGSRFIHSEKFTGLLVPLFRASLDRYTRKGFEAMNQALRDRCEALAGDAATPSLE